MKFNIIKFKPKQTKGLECLNCRKPLNGNENFCSYCGQKNTTKKLSFGNFLNNLFSGFLSYDSRFWRTFIPLLIKPGKVSKEYIEGKRARFVNPFQLYLNVSIIFFLILGITNNIDFKNITNEINKVPKSLDSLSKVNKEQIDSLVTNVQTQVNNTIPKDSTQIETIIEVGNIFKLYDTKTDKPKKNMLIM